MFPKSGFSYIGRKPCGCMVTAIIDNPDTSRAVATEVASWLRQGLTVERVTHQVVRDEFMGWMCPHAPPKPEQMPLFDTLEESKRFEAATYAINQEIIG